MRKRSQKTVALALASVLVLAGLSSGCFRREYSIRGPEAQRAIQTLKHQDSVVVAAANMRTHERVHIELHANDYLDVLPEYDGSLAADLKATRPDGRPVENLALRQFNLGPLLMIVGGGVVGAGYLFGLMSAPSDSRAFIPLYGAPAAVFDETPCEDPDGDCGWAGLALIPAALSMIVQGIGLVTLITGAILYRPSPEVSIYDDQAAGLSGLHFGLFPLGEQGAVCSLGFRF
jgi:hypothetical protein